MTLEDMLIKQEPSRRAKIRKGTPRLKALYDAVCANYDSIERAQFAGYSWTQINSAFEEMCRRNGIWENGWGVGEVNAMFSFVRKEREIKGVA